MSRCGRGDLDLKLPGVRHQGVVAAVPAQQVDGEALLSHPATPDRLLLVLDGVQDPHNLGACLRTAEAVGVDAVIIPRDRAAGLTAVARKAAAGSAERVPLVTVTNLSRTLERLQTLGYWITGLAGEAGETLYQADLTGPLVMVMGAEGEGMRRLTGERATDAADASGTLMFDVAHRRWSSELLVLTVPGVVHQYDGDNYYMRSAE